MDTYWNAVMTMARRSRTIDVVSVVQHLHCDLAHSVDNAFQDAGKPQHG